MTIAHLRRGQTTPILPHFQILSPKLAHFPYFLSFPYYPYRADGAYERRQSADIRYQVPEVGYQVADCGGDLPQGDTKANWGAHPATVGRHGHMAVEMMLPARSHGARLRMARHFGSPSCKGRGGGSKEHTVAAGYPPVWPHIRGRNIRAGPR